MEFIKILTLIKRFTVWEEEFIFLLFLLLSGCNHKESEKRIKARLDSNDKGLKIIFKCYIVRLLIIKNLWRRKKEITVLL